MNRVPSRYHSPERYITSVGTLMTGSTSRMSISAFMSRIALLAPGLAPRSTYDVYQRRRRRIVEELGPDADGRAAVLRCTAARAQR